MIPAKFKAGNDVRVVGTSDCASGCSRTIRTPPGNLAVMCGTHGPTKRDGTLRSPAGVSRMGVR